MAGVIVSGTHGVGKTTLVKNVVKECSNRNIKVNYILEQSRDWIDYYGYNWVETSTVEREDSAEIHTNFELALFYYYNWSLKHSLAKNENFIADRSIIDVLAYTRMFIEDNKFAFEKEPMDFSYGIWDLQEANKAEEVEYILYYDKELEAFGPNSQNDILVGNLSGDSLNHVKKQQTRARIQSYIKEVLDEEEFDYKIIERGDFDACTKGLIELFDSKK